MVAAVKRNEIPYHEVLFFSGSSDNDPSVALGLDIFLNISGSVPCICYSLSISVNDAIRSSSFLMTVLERLQITRTYIKSYARLNTKSVQLQFQDFSQDGILTLDRNCPTRWHSKLTMMEKYVIPRLYLEKNLPDDDPSVIDPADDECIREYIIVLR